MCFETACLLVLNSSAMALGVIDWAAINSKIALRVGSANPWNMSRLAFIAYLDLQPFDC